MHHTTAGTLVDALTQALIRVAPSAVVTLDKAGRVLSINGPAGRLLSIAPEDAEGQPYQSVLGPSLSDRLVGLFLRSGRAEGGVDPYLVRVTLPGGRRAELRANAGPIRDAAGLIEGVLLVADEAEVPPGPDSALTERLRLALRRYLGDDIATMVEERPSFIGVGGVRRRVSLVHADMRGYTSQAELLQPEDTIELLLRYHGKAVEALQGEGATLDRFIGDSVLAIWNAPHDVVEHAAASLRGALAVRRAAEEAGSELAYGIGVHTGDAIVGNIGSGRFINYTAVGDTVNIAARLQAEAERGQVLCSAQVLLEAGDDFEARPLGAIKVRGRAQPIEALELLRYRGGSS